MRTSSIIKSCLRRQRCNSSTLQRAFSGSGYSEESETSQDEQQRKAHTRYENLKRYTPSPIYGHDGILDVDHEQSSIGHLTKWLFGASAFQAFVAGFELNVFEHLNTHGAMSREELMKETGLQERAADILLMCLTSMGTLTLNDGKYENAESIKVLFNDDLYKCYKAFVGFEQYIVYQGIYDFTESLKQNSNIGLQRVPGRGRDLYHRLSENPYMEKKFYEYMNSFTRMSNRYLVENVNFEEVNKVLDVGGGTAINAIAIAQRFPHLHITVIDIEQSAMVARANVLAAGLDDRITVLACDFFENDLPKGHDCVLFSHQLVIWTPDENVGLLKKAKAALEPNGRVVVFNSMSNDDGTGPLMAALDSVYFAAIPAQGGMIYSFQDYVNWLTEAGFSKTTQTKCHGFTPHGIVEGHVE